MSNYDKTAIRPIIALRFDDVHNSVYTTAKPILDKYGIKCSVAPVSDLIDTSVYMTSAQILQMFNEGHEILSHTKTHKGVGILSTWANECADEAAVVTELSASKTAIEAIIGEGNCKGMAYPFHNLDEVGLRCLLASGYKYGGGGDTSSPAICRAYNGFDSASGLARLDAQAGRFKLGRNSISSVSFAAGKPALDYILSGCHALQLVCHDVQPTPTVNGMTPEVFEAQIKYLYDNGAQFVTTRELYNYVIGGKHLLLQKGINLAIDGDLRFPNYTDDARPGANCWYVLSTWTATPGSDEAPPWVFSTTGGPISSWDGKECGYLKVEYQNQYHHTPVIKQGTYRLTVQVKKGDSTKNMEITVLTGSTVAPTKYTLATETITAANIPADWTVKTYTFDLPAGSRNILTRVRPASAEDGKYHYFSNVTLERIK